MSWLGTTDAVRGYRFGYALASNDLQLCILPQLIISQRQISEKNSLFFLGGYLRGVFERDIDLWEQLMDGLALDASTSFWTLELTWRAGIITERAAQRVLRVLKEDNLPPWLLGQFTYSGSLNTLSASLFNEWIDFLLESASHKSACSALGMYSDFYVSSAKPRTSQRILS